LGLAHLRERTAEPGARRRNGLPRRLPLWTTDESQGGVADFVGVGSECRSAQVASLGRCSRAADHKPLTSALRAPAKRGFVTILFLNESGRDPNVFGDSSKPSGEEPGARRPTCSLSRQRSAVLGLIYDGDEFHGAPWS
jgi:hypothetical protein